MNMNEIQVNLAQGINKEYELAQENYIKSQEYGTRALFHAKNCGEKLIEAKNNCEPKMIHEFITSDRSFFMDLQFEYYTPEQIAEKIKVTLGKNK